MGVALFISNRVSLGNIVDSRLRGTNENNSSKQADKQADADSAGDETVSLSLFKRLLSCFKSTTNHDSHFYVGTLLILLPNVV